jgi:hypothetical protein
VSFTAAGIEWIDAHEGAQRFGFDSARGFREWAKRCRFPARVKPGFARMLIYDVAAIERVFHVEKSNEVERHRAE